MKISLNIFYIKHTYHSEIMESRSCSSRSDFNSSNSPYAFYGERGKVPDVSSPSSLSSSMLSCLSIILSVDPQYRLMVLK